MEFKLVLSTKDGQSYQREIKSPQADYLLKKKIGDIVKGDSLGFAGYEFKVTGGSDKCGFPMRKGIQQARKLIMIGESIGFSGKKRRLGKKTTRKNQKGLLRRRTVCGEMITKIIHQVNMQVVKEGMPNLGVEAAFEVAEQKSKTAAQAAEITT